MTYPLLTSRNAQVVAHLQATMTDSLVLAEALLLSNRDDSAITHLQIYKFYSGQTLHTFLNKQIPEGWKWREADQTIYDQCWEALVDGIQDKIVGFTLPSTTTMTIVHDEKEGGADEQEVEVPEKEVVKKRKKNKGKGGGGKTPKPSGGVGGRFDLLSGLDG